MSNLVSPNIAKKLGFYSIESAIAQFKDVSLSEMVRVNSKTVFPTAGKKICYRMEYKTLAFSSDEALDNYTTTDPRFRDAYVKQPMHSISGEQKDICLYSYGPQDMVNFLEQNKTNHYTYLPLTVHATESANGYRHDMLIIFDNKTKLFYWFDGRNREDYMPFGNEIPKNVIDILLINISNNIKLGYTYEPSPSWVIQDVLQPFASVGQFDFIFSTTWCYLIMQMLDDFDSPIGLLSALDTMSREDRFHLLYSALLHMVGVFCYHKTVPQNAQINFFESPPTAVVSNQPRSDPAAAAPSLVLAEPVKLQNNLFQPAEVIQSTVVHPQADVLQLLSTESMPFDKPPVIDVDVGVDMDSHLQNEVDENTHEPLVTNEVVQITAEEIHLIQRRPGSNSASSSSHHVHQNQQAPSTPKRYKKNENCSMQ